MGFLTGNSLLKSGITFDFITQSKLLGGSTPQTPRWGRGAVTERVEVPPPNPGAH
ncbi:mobile element protein [Microcystis sp. 0824]|nr:mobile element protein [Microcystis sp. 0824]